MAVLVLGPGAPALGASGDSATPALVSFSLSPKTVTPGQIVSIDYAVSDDSDEITDLIFTFADAIGNSRQLRVDNIAGIALNGTITQTVPSGWVNGSYRLADVYILDAAGNHSSYGRNGTIYKYPQGASGPTSHTLNFSTADFTVEGSSADSATPALVSFSRQPEDGDPRSDRQHRLRGERRFRRDHRSSSSPSPTPSGTAASCAWTTWPVSP